MTAVIIVAIVGVWFLAAGVFVLTASMMSARISRMEEGPTPIEEPRIIPLKAGRKIPTQPRTSTAN